MQGNTLQPVAYRGAGRTGLLRILALTLQPYHRVPARLVNQRYGWVTILVCQSSGDEADTQGDGYAIKYSKHSFSFKLAKYEANRLIPVILFPRGPGEGRNILSGIS